MYNMQEKTNQFQAHDAAWGNPLNVLIILR